MILHGDCIEVMATLPDAIAEARLNGVQRGLGLDVPAPTQRRDAIGSKYDGPRKTPTAKWTGVYSDKGGIATGRPGGYEGTPKRPKPPKPKADTAEVWPEEAA